MSAAPTYEFGILELYYQETMKMLKDYFASIGEPNHFENAPYIKEKMSIFRKYWIMRGSELNPDEKPKAWQMYLDLSAQVNRMAK